jgi:hypothetical protein
MDFGLLVFAAAILFLPFYAKFHVLARHWREVRAKEQPPLKTHLEHRVERLVKRAEAQERTLEDSRRKLEPAVEELDRVSGEYGKRLENLEAVVVGQVWNRLDQPGLGTRPHEVAETSKDERSRNKRSTKNLNRRRTAKLAHRVDK